jgi:thiopurine S-methyltransferase
MDPDFWHQKWARNDIGFHVGEANPLLVDSFHRLSLAPGGRVFLPLCGKTLDIAWLLDQGYRVVGIELNQSAIEQLFAELGAEPVIRSMGKLSHYAAQNIDIYIGDFFNLTSEILGPVDVIYDRAALVALPEKMRKRYSQHLMALTEHAPQLLITYVYDQTVLDGPPFSVSEAEVHGHYDVTYELSLIDTIEVPGGFKGKCPAVENVWLLQNK